MEGDTSRVLVLVTANPRNSVVNSITDPIGYEVEETTESKEIEIDEDCSQTTCQPQVITTSTPSAFSASARSRILSSLSPNTAETITQQELTEAEEHSLTSL